MSSNHHMGISVPSSGEIDHMGFLSEHIGALYMNHEYSDVRLKVGDQSFHAHKVILAARSEYFRALLFGGMKESQQSEVELVDTNVTAFKTLLKYIYTGQMSLASLKEESILDMLGLAHQYVFEDLETAICDYLRQSLTSHNVCSIFDVARLYQLSCLTKVCKNFIDECAHEVISTQGFLNLSAGGLKEIIERDSFYAEEIDIFRAVMMWVRANTADLKSPEVTDVLSAVRFPLMSSNELFSEVRPTGCVSSETILDALQLQTISRDSCLPYRGVLKLNENVANPQLGAQVLQGEIRSALLDGNSFNYDMEKGYTRHIINEVGDHGILIKLGTPAILNHIRMLLWDKDLRSYSYYIEVSMNQKDWVRVVDYSNYHCRSWQKLYFEARVVKYIRVVGTYNTVNKVFHAVSFEILYQTDPYSFKDSIIVPKHNVATTHESAMVIEGVSRSRNALLDGNTKFYDWDSGYTCHQLGSGSILVQLGQPYYIDSMRLLLWDCDDRSYCYYVEVSVNMTDWEVVCDKSHQYCRSWQYITFPMRPVVHIRIVGTHNTANEVFHCVHFECPAQTDEPSLRGDMAKLSLSPSPSTSRLPAITETSETLETKRDNYTVSNNNNNNNNNVQNEEEQHNPDLELMLAQPTYKPSDFSFSPDEKPPSDQ